jgi:hypothetical protein
MLTAVLKAVKMLLSCCPKNSQDAAVLTALKAVQDAEKNHPHKYQVQRLIPINRGNKLMGHTMKLWERIIEHRLRGVTNVTENQFGFMSGRSIMEAIFLIRQLMERCREQKKDLHMVFIDLEEAYDKVPRNIM